MKYKAVFFDFGNVWLDFDHWRAVDKIARFSPLDKKEIFDVFFDSEYTEKFEEGRVSPRDFFNAIRPRLKLNLGIEQFNSIWNDIFFLTPDNLKVHSLAKLLKKDLFILLISNINILHFEFLKKQFDIFGVFDRIVLSYEVGARKPKPEIYDTALRLSNAGPEEVIYTDDRPDLIAEAGKMGIDCIRFEGARALEEKLNKILENS
ncbi:MAG: HAD family phosphatase [Candidatus Omnitrophica bacterium]|nr:HAD family phosphatase [Candidatus Omnitrophota bacterium]